MTITLITKGVFFAISIHGTKFKQEFGLLPAISKLMKKAINEGDCKLKDIHRSDIVCRHTSTTCRRYIDHSNMIICSANRSYK
jgi:hypothetical protein